MDETRTDDATGSQQGSRYSSLVTLVLTPLVIVLIWLLENYLLAGTTRLFQQASVPGLVLYTVLAGILVGIIVPIVRIRAAFLSGAVNMFQIGFRSARRTVAAVSLTALAGYAFFIITGTPGIEGLNRVECATLFMLLLPIAIATVMICWVLVGTHVQAYFRSEGVIVSVITGVVITALIFALSLSILFAGPDFRELFTGFFVAGCIAAFFFFAVRDVYATIIVVTSGLVVFLNARIDPAYLGPISPVVILCGIVVTVVLIIVHWHFSRHYTTIVLPEK
ncbi:MAG: hypothetical protein WAK75_07925 [Methanoregula sp.]|uniref:hypothetical protein n=1 Tax=Methanoregula sp. TaxID=2052170 RepID=UPI003BAEDF53